MYGGVTDPEPAREPPPAYSSSGGDTGAIPERTSSTYDEPWWDDLGDPALDPVVRQVLAVNLSLRAARARVRQADALARQLRSGRFPQVSFQADAGIGTQRNQFSGTLRATSLSASLPVSYEIDLFARRAHDAEAAELDASAARLEVQSAHITLAAEVSEAWFDLRNARAQRELLAAQLETNQTFLGLVELRFNNGLTSAVDVHQQRQQVAGTEAQIAMLDGQEEIIRQRLAILMGMPPGQPFESAAPGVPSLPPPPNAQVPASLLQNRPDIRAAQRRIEAADRRVSSSIAQRLPTITLSFTPSYTWQRTAQVEAAAGSDLPPQAFEGTVHGFVYQAGARLNVPLFDGFRGRGAVDMSRAQVAEAVENFHEVILRALLEVESALVLERQERIRVQHLERRIELANATLEASQDRYREGLSDFLPVLQSIAIKQGAEVALVDARRQLVSHRIQLHRALGGTWPEEFLRAAERRDAEAAEAEPAQ